MIVKMSSWTLVVLTIERIISVWVPFKCKELCSRRRVIFVWCLFFVLLCGLNGHFFVTYKLFSEEETDASTNTTVRYIYCSYDPLYESFWSNIWYWIDAWVKDFATFGILMIGNLLIISRIIVANRLRRGQMQATTSDRDDKNKAKGGKVKCG